MENEYSEIYEKLLDGYYKDDFTEEELAIIEKLKANLTLNEIEERIYTEIFEQDDFADFDEELFNSLSEKERVMAKVKYLELEKEDLLDDI